LKHCRIYGVEQISQFIRESPRLRMLVPRVYGLGDLGQILDARAYDQAQEILSSLGDDMNKFVITAAYRAAARAIVEHGFVLLLGEPACGKSSDEAITEREGEEREAADYGEYYHRTSGAALGEDSRSIFDDVDD